MDVEQEIRSYLPDIVHMSLGTSSNNKPWVCEVHYVYDEALNLYFRSLLSRRHSLEIKANPFVAGNIVTQHEVGQKVRAVYFEGQANELTVAREIDEAFALFKERLGVDDRAHSEAKQPDGHHIFKIVVDTFYLFDGRTTSPAQKYELVWNSRS